MIAILEKIPIQIVFLAAAFFCFAIAILVIVRQTEKIGDYARKLGFHENESRAPWDFPIDEMPDWWRFKIVRCDVGDFNGHRAVICTLKYSGKTINRRTVIGVELAPDEVFLRSRSFGAVTFRVFDRWVLAWRKENQIPVKRIDAILHFLTSPTSKSAGPK